MKLSIVFVHFVAVSLSGVSADMNHVARLRNLQSNCDRDGDGFQKTGGKCGGTYTSYVRIFPISLYLT